MKRTREVAAFQGELGAFSHEAVQKLLGNRTAVVPCPKFEDLYVRLRDKDVTAAIVPIENTLAGSVHENYDHFLNYDFEICGETNLRISHNLMAAPGVRFRDIRKAYSHPVALNQCLDFFSRNPQIEKVPFYDTAGSVKMVIERRLSDAAAIGSAVAATIYGAAILRKSLEDDRRNFTRFFLLRRPSKERRMRHNPAHGEWKTSIVFSTRNTPGALFRALSAFALRDVNLTKIESRPLRGRPWEYMFYVDFIGRSSDPVVQKALGHIQELADFLRVLGSYPKGD